MLGELHLGWTVTGPSDPAGGRVGDGLSGPHPPAGL